VKVSSTCNPYGEPSYDLATEDGIFLWKEGNVWHLIAAAGFSGMEHLIGSIVSDTEFSNVTPVTLEVTDNLDTSNAQEITFDMTMLRPSFDGLDFEVESGATVYFDVQSEISNAIDLVFIGRDRCPVNHLPTLLSSACNPYGEPNYDLATKDGIFLWKEGNVWHLRAGAGSSGWQRYTGSIVSDMPPTSVTPVSFEASDTLDISDPQEIIFNMNMSVSWFDGIDFEFPAGAVVYFDVQTDSGVASNLVFIGGNQCSIAHLPYQLPSDSNTMPVASFTADLTLGEAPLEVNVDAAGAQDPDGSIVSYEWDFGDGTDPESGVTTSHTYNTSGTYNLTLTVTDDYGSSNTTNQIITVGVSTTCNPYGEPSYDLETEDGVFLWKEGNVWHLRAGAGFSGWQRYTGSIVSDTEFSSVTPVKFEADNNLDISNPQVISFDMNMSAPWFDGVDLEVEAGATVYFDVQTDSGVAADLVFIGGDRCPVGHLPYRLSPDSNILPVASFTANSILGVEPLEVHFDASGAYDSDGLIISYEWDFGDVTGSGVTTRYIYNTPGTYNVMLTVTDDDGSINTATQAITVEESQNVLPVAGEGGL